MTTTTIQLGTQSLRALARRLRDLEQDCKPMGDVIGAATRIVADDVLRDARANLQAAQGDLDGNYFGSSPSSMRVLPTPNGMRVVWTGEQIAYLEFGTGAAGAANIVNPAGMSRAGYWPDSTKTEWWYFDTVEGDFLLSTGLVPHAPLYLAAVMQRMGGAAYRPAAVYWKNRVSRAFNVV